MVRASITADEWQAFRILAIQSNLKIQDLVAEAMRALLAESGNHLQKEASR